MSDQTPTEAVRYASEPMSELINQPLYADQVAADVSELVEVCHALAAQAGWWRNVVDGGTVDLTELINNGSRFAKALVAEKLMLTVSELGEAMEGHRKNLMDDKLPQYPMLTVELADAVIRIFDMAGAMKLPLGEALVAKLQFNTQRPDHKLENRAKDGGKAY